MEVNKDVIISMAIETWRFRRIFDRLLTKLDPLIIKNDSKPC